MIERAVDVYVANSDIPGLARLAVFALILYLAYMLSTRSYMVIMAKTYEPDPAHDPAAAL